MPLYTKNGICKSFFCYLLLILSTIYAIQLSILDNLLKLEIIYIHNL